MKESGIVVSVSAEDVRTVFTGVISVSRALGLATTDVDRTLLYFSLLFCAKMFKLDLSPKYRWPVSITLVAEDGSEVESTFHVNFARVKHSEMQQIVAAVTSQDDDTRMSDQQFLERLVLGWEGVLGSDGKEMEFSQESLLILGDVIGARGAIVRAWFESIREGPAKNSEAAPSPG